LTEGDIEAYFREDRRGIQMPVHVEKAKDHGWVIIETATGKVKGHSSPKKKAEISASYRNAAWKKKKGGSS